MGSASTLNPHERGKLKAQSTADYKMQQISDVSLPVEHPVELTTSAGGKVDQSTGGAVVSRTILLMG
uniref:Uncharacterized protein n=1 Tax=Heterorhabditis bacteriophora TaxID=37862 RepID=A0A1I7XRU7_HETBA